MATAIVLTENDVPGAKLPFECIEQNSLTDLKRWLQCRGLKVSGVKSELVKRVRDAVATGIDDIDVKIDNNKWYLLKKQSLTKGSHLADRRAIPDVPKAGWNTFPSMALPEFFNYGHIHHYFEDELLLTGGNTQKPLLKGKQFFRSGHVQDIQDVEKNNLYFVKSQVMSSFNTSILYSVCVVLCTISGYIKYSSCQCKASSLGRCSHVAGLLFALDSYIKMCGSGPPPCTSTLCTWNKGRPTKKNPQKVQDAEYDNVCKKQKILFDPRQTKQEKATASSRLKACVSNLPQSGWTSLLKSGFEDYILTEERKMVLAQLRREFMSCLKAVVPTSSEPFMLVSEQNSERWHLERSWRLTASNAKVIFSARTEKTVFNVLKRLLWFPLEFRSLATTYGLQLEVVARAAYNNYILTQNSALFCHETGFWVSGEHPELGCSPDGLVVDRTSGNIVGLLEIKCPYILREQSVLNFDASLSNDQRHNFCLTRDATGTVMLKRNHQYFYQVQTQIGVMNVDWCDFMVFSEKDFFIERIFKNNSLWSEVQNKLTAFYYNRYIPEYFEMRIPRKLKPFFVA